MLAAIGLLALLTPQAACPLDRHWALVAPSDHALASAHFLAAADDGLVRLGKLTTNLETMQAYVRFRIVNRVPRPALVLDTTDTDCKQLRQIAAAIEAVAHCSPRTCFAYPLPADRRAWMRTPHQ